MTQNTIDSNIQTNILNADHLNYIAPPQDRDGNVAYAANFRYFRATRVAAVAFFIGLIAAIGVILLQAERPPAVLVVRVDDAGRADVIRYRANEYTPREAEIRAALNNWAIDRYRLLKAVVTTDFRRNYYFLDQRLAQESMSDDAQLVAKVVAGGVPEQDVQVNNIRFTSFDTTKLPNGVSGSGECVIDVYRIEDAIGQPQKEHWTLTVKYVVNPSAAAERAASQPAYQLENPLGVTIIWFHLDRAFN